MATETLIFTKGWRRGLQPSANWCGNGNFASYCPTTDDYIPQSLKHLVSQNRTAPRRAIVAGNAEVIKSVINYEVNLERVIARQLIGHDLGMCELLHCKCFNGDFTVCSGFEGSCTPNT